MRAFRSISIGLAGRAAALAIIVHATAGCGDDETGGTTTPTTTPSTTSTGGDGGSGASSGAGGANAGGSGGAGGSDGGGGAAPQAVYPGASWEQRAPAQLGLDASGLDALRDYVGGSGFVVRDGYEAYSWGNASGRQDVASAAKPIYSTFLLLAVEEGLLDSVDDLVRDAVPALDPLNASLGYKDRTIRWRHMASQTSCYGVSEAPGTAFDYNDWQMALFWDALFLHVYDASYETVDDTVLVPRLCARIGCEDDPTFLAFGVDDRAGRVAISPRDFARFGWLFLNRGRWSNGELLPPSVATMAVTSPLSNSIPRTTAVEAEMIAGQRSIGSGDVPDDQTDHLGSYSWLWWTNGVDRNGLTHWPDAPADTYGAFGHGGRRAMAVIPSERIVVSWNDSNIEGADMENAALSLLVGAIDGD